MAAAGGAAQTPRAPNPRAAPTSRAAGSGNQDFRPGWFPLPSQSSAGPSRSVPAPPAHARRSVPVQGAAAPRSACLRLHGEGPTGAAGPSPPRPGSLAPKEQSRAATPPGPRARDPAPPPGPHSPGTRTSLRPPHVCCLQPLRPASRPAVSTSGAGELSRTNAPQRPHGARKSCAAGGWAPARRPRPRGGVPAPEAEPQPAGPAPEAWVPAHPHRPPQSRLGSSRAWAGP